MNDPEPTDEGPPSIPRAQHAPMPGGESRAQPLSYATPQPAKRSVLQVTFAAAGAFAGAAGVTLGGGALLFLMVGGLEIHPSQPPRSHLAAHITSVIILTATVAFGVPIWVWFKSPHQMTLRRFALLGMLIGFAATFLLEGICFACN